MAASSSPQGSHCTNCGTALDWNALVCPNCRRLIHAAELEQLAQRARQLAAMGQFVAAKEHWAEALRLLPAESNQAQAVQREIEKIDRRMSPQQPGEGAPKTDWRKRLGPLGVGLAFLLTKAKFLFLFLMNFKAIFSLVAFFGFYWALFGWPFAAGMAASIFLHEMGHYVMVKRFGFAAELPVFLPGFGAYVKWQGANVDPGVRAQISLAGPLFGLISGLLAYGAFLSTGQGVWLAIAHFAGWLNLLNLIPVLIFDGGSAMNALGRQERLAILAISVVMGLLLHQILFGFVAAGTAYRLWKRDFAAQPNFNIGYYFGGLSIALGLLTWFSAEQAGRVFAR